METTIEIQNYKVGQKIWYNFGHKVPSYRWVEIEFLNSTTFRFKNITGKWPRSEKWIGKEPTKKLVVGLDKNEKLIYKN